MKGTSPPAPSSRRGARCARDAIRAAHPRIHAAEGHFYRDVLRDAAEATGLPTPILSPRDLDALAARAMDVALTELSALLADAGSAVGRPWRETLQTLGIASENWRGGRDSNPTIAAINNENRSVHATEWANGGRTEEPARAFLEGLATGTLVGEKLHEAARCLADKVLAEPRVALARQVLERGPHWVRASVELADAILASEAALEGGKEVAS